MQTVFREVFGASPIVRTIDFFLDNQEFAYSMADVRREEGISYNTLKPIWDELVRIGALIKEGTYRKANLYKLNKKHPLVIRLIELDETLVECGVVA